MLNFVTDNITSHRGLELAMYFMDSLPNRITMLISYQNDHNATITLDKKLHYTGNKITTKFYERNHLKLTAILLFLV